MYIYMYETYKCSTRLHALASIFLAAAPLRKLRAARAS